ncbi:Gramicidin S synthase 2 [Pseudoalteromonas holothuriae]|uniref:Gramicidin S synthase 2 n=1 Tax=Pseudoalteromonas holothuriae TaxID=2963714 RepID=A0ABM9GD34_9GAMM|nr:non-ribosomal peptide synthetase [Pseudoalteromonas sp. CIP111951]CAH9050253.1 Gramicidin S synthase 2 [Pseudoalteromonas sp. CIP111951]
MILEELIKALKHANISLSLRGEELSIKAPAGALTDILKVALKTHKQALVSALKSKSEGLREVDKNVTPLTKTQYGIWLASHLNPAASSAYNMPAAMMITGHLNDQALLSALAALSVCYPVLNSRVQQQGDQVVLIRNNNLSAITATMSELNKPEIAQQLDTFAQRPFDLANGPLFRAQLHRLSSTEHILFLAVHHIVADGQSINVLKQRLSELYSSYSRMSQSIEPSEPQWGFEHYAHWLAKRNTEGQLSYWLSALDDSPQRTNLPFRLNNTSGMSLPSQQHLTLPAQLSDQIRAQAKLLGCTTNMLMLSAFHLFLGKLSGQQDVVVGIPSIHRPFQALQDAVGLFLDVLPIRLSWQDSNSIESLITQCRDKMTLAFRHSEIAFHELVANLPQPRGEHHPIFQCFFNFLPNQSSELHFSGCDVLEFETPLIESKFDLTLYVEEHERIKLTAQFNAAHYSASYVEIWLHQYAHLLSRICDGVSAHCADVSLRHQPVLHEDAQQFNVADLVHPLAQLKKWCHKQPNAIALTEVNQSYTYAQLVADIQTTAERLPDGVSAIAIIAQRSYELVVHIYACLAKQRPFFLINPDYPHAKQQAMLEQAKIGRVIDLVKETSYQLVSRSDTALTSSNDVAYYAATSGSTGKAKIVLGGWQSLANYTLWSSQYFAIQPGTVCSMLSNVGHDPLLRDVFSSLGNGATLAIAGMITHAEQLLHYLDTHKVNVAGMSPALAKLLSLQGEYVDLPALSHLWLIGETLSTSLASELLGSLPDTVLHNLYGATETQQFLSAFSMTTQAQLRGASCPVGRSLSGGQCLILNAGHEAGVGEIGEVVFVSQFVSQGYLVDESLDQPFFVYQGQRAYRSGDLGYWDEQGNIILQGRKDSQIQIRGFRVEPQEIVNTLEQMADVQHAVVQFDKTKQGISAYLETAQNYTFDDVVAYCQKFIPLYMCPVEVNCVASIPRNSHGKVDFQALRQLTQTTQYTYVAPQNDREAQVASIFSQVLEKQVCCKLHFYAQGGHSLGALKVVSQLRTEMGLEIPLEQFIKCGDVQSLAKYTASTDEQQAIDEMVICHQPEMRFEPFELGVSQRGLQVSRQIQKDSGENGGFSLVEIRIHNFSLNRLQNACNELVARHDVLRAIELADQRIKVLENVPGLELDILDLSALDTAQQLQKLDDHRQRLINGGVDTQSWPSFKVSVIDFGDEQRLSLCVAHTLMDYSSGVILAKDLSQLYSGDDQPLSPLSLTYRDVVVAKANHKSAARYRQDKAFWREKIATMPCAPQLPLAKDDLTAHDATVKTHYFRVCEKVSQRIAALCAQQGCSESALVLEVVCQALSVWSETPNFTMSLLVNDRPVTPDDAAQIVGNFNSLLLFSYEPKPYQTFSTKLIATQKQLSENMAHRSFEGLEVLHEYNRLHNTNMTMPIGFTSLLTEQQNSVSEQVAYREVVNTAHVGLEFVARKHNTSLEIKVIEKSGYYQNFVPDLLDAIESYLTHLANENTSWHSWQQFNISAPLRAGYNHTYQSLSSGLLHQPLIERALKQPSLDAVIQGQTRITYGQLITMADRLAEQLRTEGVKNNELVAIHMPKAWQQVVAVLAVHLAGAAYLPVDASLPLERRLQLIRQGEARLAIVSQRDSELLSCQQILLPHLPEPVAILNQPKQSSVSEDDLAYVLFTSGSTGTPKGVMISHRAARNTIEDINTRFVVTADDSVLGLSSLSFDLSVYDIFGVLAAGGKLVLPLPQQNRDPQAWHDLAAKEQITVWNSVPALMQMFVDFSAGKVSDSLRLCMLSGDWISLNLARQILTHKHVSLVSLGGATEASIWSIYYPVTHIDSNWKSVPYGHPLANQGYLVLNELMEECPVDVKGDLYITGKGLASGYWKDTQRSKQSFIFCPQRQQMLYKTGDKGRFNSDGVIEFLGREDNQVKLNGYRVELGEIEAKLSQLKELQTALVDIRHENDHKRLVAYLVTNHHQNGVPDSILLEKAERVLKDALPAYMIPQEYAGLNELPLTANGKVDRDALSRIPTTSRLVVQQPQLQLSIVDDEIQNIVINTISRQLNLVSVDLTTSFAALGGDSIQAVRLSTQLRKQGIELTLADIFNSSDIHAICGNAKRIGDKKVVQQAKQIDLSNYSELEKYEQSIMATPMQRAMVMHTQIDATAYVNQVRLTITKGFEITSFKKAWLQLVQQHQILRTHFSALAEHGLVQLVNAHADIQITEHHLLVDTSIESQLNQLASRVKHFGEDCFLKSLIKFDVCHLPDSKVELILTFHHALLDGWSLPILFAELLASYRSLSTRSDFVEKLNTAEFSRFVGWLEQQSVSDAKEYWQATLNGFTEPTRLLGEPVNDEPVEILSCKTILDNMTRKRLEQLSKSANVTMGVLINLAWARTLQRLSGDQQVIFGAVSSGRPLQVEGIEQMLGLFVVTLPVTFSSDADTSFSQALREMFGQQLESEQHSWLPLADIHRQTEIAASSALFESIVLIENYPLEGMMQHSEGLCIEEITVDSDTHFDLSLYVSLGEQLKLTLKYKSDKLDKAQADNIFALFKRILLEMLELPLASPVIELQGRSDEDNKAWEQSLANVKTTYPEFDVLQMLSEHAYKAPESIAIQCQSDELSYAQVIQRIGAISDYLRSQGVSANDRVVVCLPRSCDVILTMLALWQLGAVYVPIDGVLPQQRINNIIEQTQPVVVVCSAYTKSLCGDGDNILTLKGLSDASVISELHVAAGAGYILFTSGTTGQPKGVCVNYDALGRFLAAAQEQFTCSEYTRNLAVTTPTFDLSLLEWLLPLSMGGSVVIASVDQVKDGNQLADLVDEYNINWLQMTPTGWQVLLASGWKGKADLTALTGGEPLTRVLAQQLLNKCAAVFNCYGPTEATVFSMIGAVTHQDLQGELCLPGALSQSAHLVLSEQGDPVPLGGIGELWITGGSLSCGYLKNDKQTAERFVNLDVGLDNPVRAYRTGDLVKIIDNNSLQYLGRNDQQVKLNGFRVELQEIEHAISAIEGIESAACLITKHGVQHSLVAFVVSDHQEAFKRCQSQVKQSLPHYMHPTVWQRINSLPVHPSGKVNRAALPQITNEVEDFEAPARELEEQLLIIWQTIFEQQTISVTSGFFELGGNSLLATRLSVLCEEQLNGIKLDVKQLLSGASIRTIAQLLEPSYLVSRNRVTAMESNDLEEFEW